MRKNKKVDEALAPFKNQSPAMALSKTKPININAVGAGNVDIILVFNRERRKYDILSTSGKLVGTMAESDVIQNIQDGAFRIKGQGMNEDIIRHTGPIGKTSSGKDIYDKFSHPEHANFEKKDHADAGSLHAKKMKEHGDENLGADRYHHGMQAFKHMKAWQAMEYPKK